jgi:hypothetical protein
VCSAAHGWLLNSLCWLETIILDQRRGGKCDAVSMDSQYLAVDDMFMGGFV